MSLWKHPNVPATRVDAFRKYINRKYALNICSHQELHDWSVSDIETFAQEIWRFCGIVYSVPPTQTALGLETMYPRPTWFPGARLNYAENLLKVGLAAHPDIIAVSACREGGTQWRDLTWQELRGEVEKWASALRRAGVSKGDRVATVMTNSLECLLILLAAGAIGAIFSSTSPDMGSAGIVERYSQVKAKILFVETQVVYGGKVLDLRERLREAAFKLYELTDLQRTVIVNGPNFNGHHIQTVDTFLQGTVYPLEFEQVPFDHPIYILYSSGTTGPPKCICHSGGGVLLQQKKEHIMSGNLGLDSCYYQYSTTGWMMWNYLVSGLSCGSRIILYDGNPTYPTPMTQLEILEQHGVTVWGTSPNFLAALRRHGVQQRPALENLEIVNSSGSPLTEELFHWFYDTFPHKTGLFSGSGGTDLAAGIIMGSPLLPIYPGEIATAALGMKVEIWDGEGRDITHSGEKGDLIITKPFFSMPTTFWGENGEEKYWKAYFKAFPGVWCHGDFVMKNPETGGYRILGRSDGVLNPGGVRFGTSELYGVVDRFSEVEDCIAVGQRKDDEADERILMFLKMKTGIHLNDSIRYQIRDAIRTSLSPRHVPAFLLEVDDIPYTLNGKKIENVVRDIVSSRKLKISGTVANPEALAQYYKFETIGRPQLERAKL